MKTVKNFKRLCFDPIRFVIDLLPSSKTDLLMKPVNILRNVQEGITNMTLVKGACHFTSFVIREDYRATVVAVASAAIFEYLRRDGEGFKFKRRCICGDWNANRDRLNTFLLSKYNRC